MICILDASKFEDITRILKYGRVRRYIFVMGYMLSKFKNFYIIELVNEAYELLNRFENKIIFV